MALFKIFVGNLNRQTTPEALRDAFERYGTVNDVAIATDKATGKPRGFAFVFMADAEAGRIAINKLNRSRLDGRRLLVAAGDKKPQPKKKSKAAQGDQRGSRPFRSRGASRGAASGRIRVFRSKDEKRLPF